LGHTTTYKGLTRGQATLATLVALLVGLLALSSSGALAQDASTRTGTPNGPERVYALNVSDKLLRFDGDNPEKVNSKKITGLKNGESLVGIDFRPSAQPPFAAQQGALYGIGDDSYIYTIDPRTAVATRGARITADGNPVVLRGDYFGIDFNPTVDRLRIVSDANQNLRINVDTGVLTDFDPNTPGTQPDRDLQYAAGDPRDPNAGTDPNVTGVAYRNSQPTAFNIPGGPVNTTELYDIDARTDDMSEQDPPNNGTLVTEGSLGVNTNRLVGFDIVTRGDSPAGDRGFAALQRRGSGSSSFYGVNLDTGKATRIGTIGGGNANVEGLAIPIGQR
jgi:hypothetical protein